MIPKDRMFYKFAAYGFLKNLRLFEPFILLFFLAAGLSFTDIGILLAIKQVSVYVLEIPTGVYADAMGRRRSMLMSMTSYMLSFLIFFLFSSFWIFAIAMVLYALGDAYRTGTHKAMILEYLRIKDISDKKVEYYGATRSFSQLGSALNALLAGAVVFYTGNYREIFIITIIPYVLNFINLATYPKVLDGDIRGEIGKGKIVRQFKSTLKDFRDMLKDRIALKAIMNSSLFSGSYVAVKDYLQAVLKVFALSLPIFLYLSQDKRTALVIGVVYFFIYLMNSYASRNAYKLVNRIGNLGRAINATLIIGALTILFAGLFYHLNLLVVSIVLFLFIYVLQNLRRPMNVGYIAERIKSRVMASGLSVESQMKTIIAAFLAVLMGYLADRFGVGSALAMVGFLVLILAPFVFVRE